MKNRFIAISTVITICIGCSTMKSKTHADSLTILSATVQKWHGGQKSGGTGIHYAIRAVANVDNLEIDSLHFNTFSRKIGVMKGNTAANSIEKGDTITLKVGTSNSQEIQLTGSISYHTEISEAINTVTFKRLEDLYYP
jgi:hypothetical protein